jgi:cytochrome c peroxidase
MHHREAPGSALLALFNGKARCGTCHVPPLFTEPGWNLHKADEIGIDDFQAKRGPDDRYVTAKLRALWDTKKSTSAASTTTDDLRRSPTWSITTTITSRQV